MSTNPNQVQMLDDIEMNLISQNRLVISQCIYNKKAQINDQQYKRPKIMVILSMFILLIIYKLVHKSSLPNSQCIKDISHYLTSFINAKLNQDQQFANLFLFIGQLLIDFQLVMFVGWQIVRMKNFYISVWIGLFYGTRALFLNIDKLPYPKGIYWTDPLFLPSIGVPYGVTSDFFYSGHTGIMLFSVLFWSQKHQTRFLKYISLIGLLFIILLVISTRVHYIIDVFAAIFFTLGLYKFSKNNLVKFDSFFSQGYILSEFIVRQIIKCIKNE